jgi:predicted phage terminase large subunit-like protein
MAAAKKTARKPAAKTAKKRAPVRAAKKVEKPVVSAAPTPAQIELAQRELAKRSLVHFTKRFNPRYKAGWVHRDICRRLERFSREVEEGKSPRLMILMPPRHGKSELASRNFPAWHLGHYPHHEFIACSYNIDLARGFSRKVKQIIEDPVYTPMFPMTRLDPDNASNETWGVLQQPGGYVAAGVGGGITGKGAHVLLIDDPIKNAEEADSADNREKIWEWYLSTAYSRLAPGGGVLIIQTWWHDDDLAGRLQTLMTTAGVDDEYIDQFDVVKYPAIAEADEYLNPTTDKIVHDPSLEEITVDFLVHLRSKGDALHSERYDIDKLRRIKAQNNGGRWWSALYQQNPVPDDGGYFTKAQFRQQALPAKDKCHVYIAFDFAIRDKQQNDYTVGVVGLQDEDDMLHVADVMRFKSGDAFFIVESILNLVAKWHNASVLVGFEDGQIYRTMESLLTKRMKERQMFFPIELLKPLTDKMVRARPLQGRMQQGMVSFAAQAPWYDAMRTEMLRFPAGAHDDQVDAAAWMATLAIGKWAPDHKKARPTKSWRDRLAGYGSASISHMAA